MSRDVSEYELDLKRIEALVGRISGDARYEVVDALDEDRAGVLALAAEFAANRKVKRKAGALINAIRQDEHAGAARESPDATRLSSTERAHALFTAKLRELDAVKPDDWTARERRLYAVDYALDHCGANGPVLIAIEDELRVELDAERDGTERDHERDTPHRHAMAERFRR